MPKPVEEDLSERVVRQFFDESLKQSLGEIGWNILHIDAEQGLSVVIQKDDRIFSIDFENQSQERFYRQTRHFWVYVKAVFGGSGNFNAEESRAIDKVVDHLQSKEDKISFNHRPVATSKSEIREINVSQILIPEGKLQYYINPYTGCTIGCEFCYVQDRADFSRQLQGLPAIPWGKYVAAKINAAQVLAKEIRQYPPGIVRLSPIITDPYQPLEKKYRLTRQCLEVLRQSEFVPVILTKSCRVADDLQLISSFKLALVGFSIPTDDDKYRQLFETKGDSIEDRLAVLGKFKEAGCLTMAVIQPILPMNPQKLIDKLSPLVHCVRIDKMNFLKYTQATYTDHQLEYAMSDEYNQQIQNFLRSEFKRRGVFVDEVDNLASLVTLKRSYSV